jgi:hypothetical protein
MNVHLPYCGVELGLLFGALCQVSAIQGLFLVLLAGINTAVGPTRPLRRTTTRDPKLGDVKLASCL